MRVIMKKWSPGQIEFGIIYGGIAMLALWAARFLPVLTVLPSCVFKGLTGIPCPSCGSTRSLVHLSHGDIAASFAMNPLTTLCFLSLILYLMYSLITLMPRVARIKILVAGPEKSLLQAGAITGVLVNWIYLIVMQ